ncbi:hypothetical protein EAF04_008766 [Stromatinia cepivora]|nr:hypothetical protein EAF04_008766 [Stromatinia cepivora]
MANQSISQRPTLPTTLHCTNALTSGAYNHLAMTTEFEPYHDLPTCYPNANDKQQHPPRAEGGTVRRGSLDGPDPDPAMAEEQQKTPELEEEVRELRHLQQGRGQAKLSPTFNTIQLNNHHKSLSSMPPLHNTSSISLRLNKTPSSSPRSLYPSSKRLRFGRSGPRSHRNPCEHEGGEFAELRYLRETGPAGRYAEGYAEGYADGYAIGYAEVLWKHNS